MVILGVKPIEPCGPTMPFVVNIPQILPTIVPEPDKVLKFI